MSQIVSEQIVLQMASLRTLIDKPGVYEVLVNRPGEVWVETGKSWEVIAAPELTFERLEFLARVIATYAGDVVDQDRSILSATLPTGERVQVVRPPSVGIGQFSLTVRKPSSSVWSLEELGRGNLFSAVRLVGYDRLTDGDSALVAMLDERNYVGFLAAAVRAKKNIIISGATGSGKTTLSKALIAHIPLDERIITIEDTPELIVPHRNSVQLLYAMGGRGRAQVTPKQLLEACLRMRPDRILMQELRDGTAFDYIRNVNSGHPGSITTVHATSAAIAFEQLTLLVKQNEAGSRLDRSDIQLLLRNSIDVIVQTARVDGEFRVTEVYFAPHAGRAQVKEAA